MDDRIPYGNDLPELDFELDPNWDVNAPVADDRVVRRPVPQDQERDQDSPSRRQKMVAAARTVGRVFGAGVAQLKRMDDRLQNVTATNPTGRPRPLDAGMAMTGDDLSPAAAEREAPAQEAPDQEMPAPAQEAPTQEMPAQPAPENAGAPRGEIRYDMQGRPIFVPLDQSPQPEASVPDVPGPSAADMGL
jgi:hypothetical protein